MQLIINSFRQLFPDKIFSLTFLWFLVKSLTFPWQLSIPWHFQVSRQALTLTMLYWLHAYMDHQSTTYMNRSGNDAPYWGGGWEEEYIYQRYTSDSHISDRMSGCSPTQRRLNQYQHSWDTDFLSGCRCCRWSISIVYIDCSLVDTYGYSWIYVDRRLIARSQ